MADERWTTPGSDASSPASPFPPPVPADRIFPPASSPYGPATSEQHAPGTPPAFSPPVAATPPAFPDPSAEIRPPAPAGWIPPPKPGLIPLAPMSFGVILGAPYRAFRRNPRPTFGMSLLVQGGVSFLAIAVIGLVAFASFSRIDFAATSAEQDEIAAGAFGITFLSALVPLALSLLATGIMQGLISLEISRQSLGEKLTFRQLWRRAKGRLWAVGGYTLALSGALLVALAIVVGIAVVPFALGGAGVAIGVVLAILLYLGALLASLALTTKLAFVPSAIVLERVGIGAAIRRSWQLTRGAFWRILGTIVLVTFIFSFASGIITQVPIFAGAILSAVIAPTGDETTAIVVIVIAYFVGLVLTLVISAIALVIQSGTSTLLYLDRRIRTEGLDLELQQFVEARQAGATGVSDPYEDAAARGAGTPGA